MPLRNRTKIIDGAQQVGYARVSTEDQDLQLQINALLKEGVCERLIFTDKMSGLKSGRPGWRRLAREVREGDTVLVWKLDRLGRSMRDLIAKTDWLKERGVGFRSLTEPFDTTSPTGELMFHVLAAMAQLERDITSERTRAGMQARMAEGMQPGVPTVMQGKKLDTAAKMVNDGVTNKSEIARACGVVPNTIGKHWKRIVQHAKETHKR